MITIALYNIKGGVGKTAGCVNLAYLAAEEGKKVLIWDLDPQGSASFYFSTEARLKGGFKKLLSGEVELEANIQSTEFENLWLLPADFSNRHLDVMVEETKQARKKFKTLLAQLQGDFDYLFIDCPPGIGALSEALFGTADFLLLPTIPTTLSMRTYDMVNAFFEENGLDKSRILAFFSMVDVRKNLHNETMEKHYRNKQFLKNYIPYLSTVEKMGAKQAPVGWFAPSSYAAQCFRDIWKELKKKIGL
jgi:cellulose biosynthesis protein BcsQ